MLIVSNLLLFFAWQGEKTDRLYYDYAVPDIDLTSEMEFRRDDSNGLFATNAGMSDIAFGKTSGLVVFPNIAQQPKDARQYYTIEATNDRDANGAQLFTLLETLKLNALPPKSFDKEVLRIISNTEQFVTLESEQGHTFRINKITGDVAITDAGCDAVSLITSQADYKTFVLRLLK